MILIPDGSNQWAREYGGGQPQQLYPIDDVKPHVLDGSPCWCRAIDVDGVIVHNSMDNREAFEEGRRKPS